MKGRILDESRAKRYSAIKTKLVAVDIVLTGALLILFQWFWSGALSGALLGRFDNFYAACLIFSSVFLVYMYIGTVLLSFLSSFVVEHRFGLSKQSIGAWLKDEAKSSVLSFVLMAAGIIVFYFVLRTFPGAWWAVFAVVWIFFSIVLTKFLPVLLIPLFYKYTPIEEGDLRGKILEVARRADVKLMEVSEIDFSRKTVKANAALVGLGKTRKVILSDTLIEKFTLDEAAAVVAHEFGHFKLKHIWQLLLMSGFVTIVGFFILFKISDRIVVLTESSSIADLKLLPIFILFMFFFGMVLLPVQNFFSRVLERAADRFALKVTGDADSFVSVMNKLAEVNLADKNPSILKKIFLYDHPPISERVQMAKDWKSAGNGR